MWGGGGGDYMHVTCTHAAFACVCGVCVCVHACGVRSFMRVCMHAARACVYQCMHAAFVCAYMHAALVCVAFMGACIHMAFTFVCAYACGLCACVYACVHTSVCVRVHVRVCEHGWAAYRTFICPPPPSPYHTRSIPPCVPPPLPSSHLVHVSMYGGRLDPCGQQ